MPLGNQTPTNRAEGGASKNTAPQQPVTSVPNASISNRASSKLDPYKFSIPTVSPLTSFSFTIPPKTENPKLSGSQKTNAGVYNL